jgi:acetyltransferase
VTTALRPLLPQDREAFQEFVRGLSAHARLNRFLAPIRELSPAALDALTRADQARHVALVATEDGRIVGEARYVALGASGHAEFAVAVADESQRHGVGARLLGALIRMARQAGLQVLEGEVLRTNTAMLRFLQRAGFRMSVCDGDARLAYVERVLTGA